MMKTGLFVGSFDPYTIGHDDIARRALNLFDRLVIGVAHNPDKHYVFPLEERLQTIAELYEDEPRIQVEQCKGLTVDFAHSIGATYIIKGIRSMKDFEYERDQRDFNMMLGGVETVFLFAQPHLTGISSTNIRQLIALGRDVSDFLPGNRHTK